jgi:phosphoribosylformylglycinamidine (FGAM) synthase-like enzyme
LLIAAIESLMYEEGPTGLGADLDLTGLPLPPVEALLSESGGFLIEVDPKDEEALHRMLDRHGAHSFAIGMVIDEPRIRAAADGRILFDEAIAPLAIAWAKRLGEWIEGGRA